MTVIILGVLAAGAILPARSAAPVSRAARGGFGDGYATRRARHRDFRYLNVTLALASCTVD